MSDKDSLYIRNLKKTNTFIHSRFILKFIQVILGPTTTLTIEIEIIIIIIKYKIAISLYIIIYV